MPNSIVDTIDKNLHKIKKAENIKPISQALKSIIIVTSFIVSSVAFLTFGATRMLENYNSILKINTNVLENISVKLKSVNFENINTDNTYNYDDYYKYKNLNNYDFVINLINDGKEINKINFIDELGYSGDIKKYKSIDKNLYKTNYLALAEKEINTGIIDLNKINKYLYKTLLEQHEVEIIGDQDGGK
jgi:hypothetical protein